VGDGACSRRLFTIFTRPDFTDDVDWNIDVKEQFSLISTALTSLENRKVTNEYPYGMDWDILMMGHCHEV
jgi:hypothetical protein